MGRKFLAVVVTIDDWLGGMYVERMVMTEKATPAEGDETQELLSVASPARLAAGRGPDGVAPVNRNVAIPTSIASIVAQAADEYLEQLTRGETPDLSDYALRYPQVASVLPQVLPVLRMIQGMASGDLSEGASQTAPSVLGEFQVIREIGRGGMGVVYEAIQVPLGRRVALKVLPMGAGADAKHLARFQIEAQVAAALHHPHIVPIFAVGCDQGVHYYAMQLIEGRCLAAVLAELRRRDEAARSAAAGAISESPGRLASYEAAGLAIQAAEALEHAHVLGVLHRDIKPANLLVDPDGHLWVTDFGLARFQGSADLTTSGDLLGTLRYMSPEQACGGRILDARTDIYSLGATLYELLTGRPAFDGNDRQELIRQITFDEPTALRKVVPTIPTDLETIVGKAMAKEPERRYSTARELADDLGRFCDDRPILARRPTLAGRMTRWSRRHRTATSVAAAILLVVALASAAGMARLWQARRQTLDALRKAESAQARERQALLFTFAASDQITSRALVRLAASSRSSSAADQDQEFCRKALAYYEELGATYDDDRSMRTIVAATYHRIGFIRTLLSQPHAREALRRSIELYEVCFLSTPSSQDLRSELALTYGDLLALEQPKGTPRATLAAASGELVLRKGLVEEAPDNREYRISLAFHQIDLCRQLEAAGRHQEATRLRETIPENARFASNDDVSDSRLCNNLAWLLVSRGQSLPHDVVLAVELAKKAISLKPALAEYWNTLGVAHYRAGDLNAAVAAFTESMRLGSGGDAHDWLFLAMARWRQGQRDAAKDWYARSLNEIETSAEHDPELIRFRDEAASVLGLGEHTPGNGGDGGGDIPASP